MASTDRASLFVCAVSAQGWVTATRSVSRQDGTAPAVLPRDAVDAQGTYILLKCNKYTSSLLFHTNSYIILRCNILWLPLVPSKWASDPSYGAIRTFSFLFIFSHYSQSHFRSCFPGRDFYFLKKKSHLSSCSCELLKP